MAERNVARDPWQALRCVALTIAFVTCIAGVGLLAAELHEETIAAWERYIAATEQRVTSELDDGERFLVLDFHEDGARLRREALAGSLVVERMHSVDERGDRFDVPRGTVQHWLGAVLVPNAELNDVLNGLQYDIPPHELQEDVLESRVLSRDGDRLELYTRVQLDAPMASAEYNLEQMVEYVRLGGGRAWSWVEGTRIAELEDPGSSNEREKPIGNDSGFLWRLKLWWRYEQVDGGVLIECEQVTLSRGIPRLARWFLAPIINGAPRSAMEKTLQGMVDHLRPPAPSGG
ncbi:MAG: hypothetical protein F4Z04_12580 [Acidobacteria bacterium]|nr:hypothetical protein [Acidobacteriota bacterium]